MNKELIARIAELEAENADLRAELGRDEEESPSRVYTQEEIDASPMLRFALMLDRTDTPFTKLIRQGDPPKKVQWG